MSAKGVFIMADVTMDKIVALAKIAVSCTPAVKSTAVSRTHGTTARSACR